MHRKVLSPKRGHRVLYLQKMPQASGEDVWRVSFARGALTVWSLPSRPRKFLNNVRQTFENLMQMSMSVQLRSPSIAPIAAENALLNLRSKATGNRGQWLPLLRTGLKIFAPQIQGSP